MNPHIIFNIKGISGISISGDEHRFDISKNDILNPWNYSWKTKVL